MTASELLQEILAAETNTENKNKLEQLATLVDGLVHDVSIATAYRDKAIAESARLREQAESLQSQLDAHANKDQSDIQG